MLLLIATLVLPRELLPPLAVIALLALVFPYIIAAGTKVPHSGPMTRIEKSSATFLIRFMRYMFP